MSKRAEDVTPHVCDSVLMEHCTQPHGNCDKCGKPLDEHPTVNVEGINTLALCQDRAAKWQRVEPGTVIPAGQPWRKEQKDDPQFAEEGVYLSEDHRVFERSFYQWFIDSSWKPPLVLPTEGDNWYLLSIRRSRGGLKFRIAKGRRSGPYFAGFRVEDIIDVAPLTDEQVARIEAAR